MNPPEAADTARSARPRVSDAKAYAESLFRTAKYRPEFPAKGFAMPATTRPSLQLGDLHQLTRDSNRFTAASASSASVALGVANFGLPLLRPR